LGQKLPSQKPVGKSYSAKFRFKFPDHTRFSSPDGMVVCHSNPLTDHFQDQPVVIVEVLSDSTCRADSGEKRDAYMMLTSLKVSSSWSRKPGGGFAIERHLGLDAEIPLPEIDASLALSDLDGRAEFA